MTFEYRPGQAEAIQQIVDAWTHNDQKTILLDGPVGSGKSVVLSHAGARVHQTRGWNSYYTTPLVSLVQQLERDPLVSQFVSVVSGRHNYGCEAGSLAEARTFLKTVGPGDDLTGSYFDPELGMTRPISVGELRRAFSGRKELGEAHVECDEGYCATGWPCPACRGVGFIGNRKCDACKKGMIPPGKIGCPLRFDCEYFVRKARAAGAPCAGLTLAYLLAVSSLGEGEDGGGGSFGPRDVIFLDEAHNLDEAGLGELTFDLSGDSIRVGAGRTGQKWKEFWDGVRPQLYDGSFDTMDSDASLIWLGMAQYVAEEELGLALEAWDDDRSDKKRYRAAVRAKRLHDKIEQAGKFPEERWVLEPKTGDPRKEPYLTVGPVLSHRFLEHHLWPLGRHRVLASGTFGNVEEYLREVGLDPSDVLTIKMKSSFPPANGAVFLQRTFPMSKAAEAEGLPPIFAAIDAILDKEPKRGIIHVPSYALGKKLQLGIAARHAGRLRFHESSNRNAQLRDWIHSPDEDSVFIGVRMTDGLDLVGDLARFQILPKAPFPDRGDLRVRLHAEMPGGDTWYQNKTLRSILQSLGRIVRSSTDVGRTYVLDTHACNLLDRGEIPDWARERIRAGYTETRKQVELPWLTR